MLTGLAFRTAGGKTVGAAVWRSLFSYKVTLPPQPLLILCPLLFSLACDLPGLSREVSWSEMEPEEREVVICLS